MTNIPTTLCSHTIPLSGSLRIHTSNTTVPHQSKISLLANPDVLIYSTVCKSINRYQSKRSLTKAKTNPGFHNSQILQHRSPPSHMCYSKSSCKGHDCSCIHSLGLFGHCRSYTETDAPASIPTIVQTLRQCNIPTYKSLSTPYQARCRHFSTLY